MELILINDHKIKITLNAFDMERYGINENDFHLSGVNIRSKLEQMLHNCANKTDFFEPCVKDKLYMQMYPEKDGGCELFVTRIEMGVEEEGMVYENNERFLPPKKEHVVEKIKKKSLCYRINGLTSLFRACVELKSRGFNGESKLFVDQSNQYFLFLSNECSNSSDNKTKSPPTSFLSEFGELENSERANLRLIEYGKLIFEQNAIEEICKALQ